MHEDLYRAQCNCSYWHGLFGGLYLNYLRDTVYRHLLVAEAFADAQLGRPAPAWAPNVDSSLAGSVVAETVDVDGDLAPEIVVQSSGLDVMIRPHEGGAIEELAYRPKTFTLTNVLGRHEEGYHQKLREYLANAKADDGAKPKSIHDIIKVKEPGLDQYLIYDRYRRLCFVDHFFSRGASLSAFASEKERDLGDFVGARYTTLRPARDAIHQAVLERSGVVDGRRVRVLKTIAVGERVLTIGYVTTQLDGAPLDVQFAPELSLTLLDGNSQERIYEVADRTLSPEERVLSSRGELREVSAIELINKANQFRVDLRFRDRRPTVWRFPLETVSNSEAGFERTYQGSVITPLFGLSLLAGGEASTMTIDLELSDL
jgi:alpha-amylase